MVAAVRPRIGYPGGLVEFDRFPLYLLLWCNRLRGRILFWHGPNMESWQSFFESKAWQTWCLAISAGVGRALLELWRRGCGSRTRPFTGPGTLSFLPWVVNAVFIIFTFAPRLRHRVTTNSCRQRAFCPTPLMFWPRPMPIVLLPHATFVRSRPQPLTGSCVAVVRGPVSDFMLMRGNGPYVTCQSSLSTCGRPCHLW